VAASLIFLSQLVPDDRDCCSLIVGVIGHFGVPPSYVDFVEFPLRWSVLQSVAGPGRFLNVWLNVHNTFD
jgi:hypothetical protein